MLIIRGHNSKEFTFDFSGPHFHDLLSVASNYLTSREFDKERREWRAPLVCMPELLELVKEKVPKEDDVRISVEAQKAYDEWTGWQDRLTAAQEAGLEAHRRPLRRLPPTFRGVLPPYQQASVEWLFRIFEGGRTRGAILGDVVGLGKTIQAIAFVEALRDRQDLESCLIVCPASLKRKWAKEIQKFTGFEAVVVEPKSRCSKKRWDSTWAGPREYTIINYDVLRRYAKEIKNLPMDCLVFDEIQYAKNHGTQRSRAARALAKRAPMVVGMSATFLENTLEDLYSVFTIINPALFLGGFWIFDRHFIERDWWKKIVGYKNLELVTERIRPFVMRRRKAEVADQLRGAIAEKVVETDYWIRLSPAQMKVYDEIKDGIVGKIADMERAGKIVMADVLAALTYLRQACLSTALVGAKEKHVHSSKLDEFTRIVESFDPEEKFVVFCYFTDMVDMIGQRLSEMGIENHAIHGKNTQPSDRQALCQSFNEGSEVRALVTSDAMREGVDLQGASTLINFDMLWNPQSMKQRMGRVDRVGQKSPIINVINLIAEGTVEERMKAVLDSKKALFEAVVEGGQSDARLSIEEVKELLS